MKVSLVDSHCHLHMLDLTEFEGELDNVIDTAHQHQINTLLTVCVDHQSYPKVLKCAEAYPHVYASYGIHPNDCEDTDTKVESIIKHASHQKVIAIGETGLDYYRDESNQQLQQASFCNHIRAAKQLNLPLIIHTRQARDDTISLLKEEGAEAVGGVLHCFTESLAMARAGIELGFYISFSGIITFKNATELQEVVKQIPSNRILIETDSPFLSPVPFRGKPNHPANVRFVAEKVAELRSESVEEVASYTTENFKHCFKLI